MQKFNTLSVVWWFFLGIVPGGLSATGTESTETKIQPLFGVTLKEDFPQARETFEEVKNLILTNYYFSELTEEALYWAAIQGMLRHISPPDNPDLARLWTAAEYEKILLSLEGVSVSLGLKSSFNANDGSLTVTEIEEKSPAEGIIQPMDRVLRIDGHALKGKSIAEINKLLNGEEFSDVVLTIVRDIKIFDIKLTRVKFQNENLHTYRLSSNLALLVLDYFSQDISLHLEKELSALKESGIQGIILDLRNNSGGVFGEALKVCHLFVPERGIVLRTYNQQEKLRNYGSGNAAPFEFRMALLVNGNTASAAEVVVGALREQNKALLVGSKTFGKGVFEKTFELKNQYRVKFITGAMYTPKGMAWQGKGFIPDYFVDQDAGSLQVYKKMDIQTRLQKDVALITAVKLMQLATPRE